MEGRGIVKATISFHLLGCLLAATLLGCNKSGAYAGHLTAECGQQACSLVFWCLFERRAQGDNRHPAFRMLRCADCKDLTPKSFQVFLIPSTRTCGALACVVVCLFLSLLPGGLVVLSNFWVAKLVGGLSMKVTHAVKQKLQYSYDIIMSNLVS
eukprot:6260507-Amphidinium_carterae.1